jgi:hypothetical protein
MSRLHNQLQAADQQRAAQRVPDSPRQKPMPAAVIVAEKKSPSWLLLAFAGLLLFGAGVSLGSLWSAGSSEPVMSVPVLGDAPRPTPPLSDEPTLRLDTQLPRLPELARP